MTSRASAPAPSRARPWVRVLFWAGAAAVVVLVAYAGAVASVRFEGTSAVRLAAGAEGVTLPSFDGGAHALRYRHGASVSFSFPLHNTGLVPITVTGVRLDDDARSMLVVDEVVVGTGPLPSRLGAGETTDVRVTARYDNCRYYHEREVESLPGATVEATALGVGVTREVGFDHPLVVRSPMIVDCPDRTLVRDDDVRR